MLLWLNLIILRNPRCEHYFNESLNIAHVANNRRIILRPFRPDSSRNSGIYEKRTIRSRMHLALARSDSQLSALRPGAGLGPTILLA